MGLIRWFGLDTLVAVLSVHVAIIDGRLSWVYLGGILVVTSFFYMCDRCLDEGLGHETVSPRHKIYSMHSRGRNLSLLVLGIISVVFWWSLPVHTQRLLAACAGIFVMHAILISVSWYSRGKDVVVAFVFSMVMVIFSSSTVAWWALIFLYALFNLRAHRAIEYPNGGGGIWWWAANALLTVTIFSVAVSIHWAWGVSFGIGLGLHALLVKWPPRYWYEWGELWFALPFLLGYGLITLCLR
jgi:hypothetical protein